MCSVLIVIFIADISNQFLISFFLDQPNLEDCRFNWYFHEMSFSLIDFFLSSFVQFLFNNRPIPSSLLGCGLLYSSTPDTHSPLFSCILIRLRALLCDIAHRSCLRGLGACVFD